MILLTILLATFYACSSDDDFRVDDTKKNIEPLTVATAQSLYDRYVGASQLKSGSDHEGINLVPDWSEGQLSSDSNWYVVESPLNFIGERQFRILSSSVEDYARTHSNPDDIKQYQRLVITRNKESGKTYAFIMLIIPQIEYMMREGDRLGDNRYLTRKSDFDGIILFFNTSGDFVNGWEYSEGRIISAMKSKESESNLRITKAAYRICLGITDYERDESGNWVGINGVMCVNKNSANDSFTDDLLGGGVNHESLTFPDGTMGSGGGGGSTSTARPDYAKAANVLADEQVKSSLAAMAKRAQDDASRANGRRERGVWIYYERTERKYYVGNEKTGAYVKGGIGTNGSVAPGGSQPHANGSHIPKTATPVTFAHVHTPLTYETDARREVGPSQSDMDYANTHNIEIIVIDYVGTLDPEKGKYYIEGGHNIEDATKEYIYIPN